MFLLYAHTAITQHWHWMDALKFSLYWHYLPGGSIGSSHRLRTQSYRTASPSILHTNASLGHHLCFSPTSQRLMVPMTSSSALIYMLKCFIELRGTFYFLEKEMATHSSILAWRIPWMVEPGGLQSMGSQRVRYDWATSLSLYQFIGLPRWCSHKESACQCRKMQEMWVQYLGGKIPWRRKWHPTPVGSCLENSMDRGVWQATAHRATKSWTWLSTYSIAQLRTSQMGETQRVCCVGRAWGFHTLSRNSTLPKSPHVLQTRGSMNSVFGIFMEAPSCETWLIKSLTINQSQYPASSFPWGLRRDWSSISLTTWLTLLATRPHP